MHQLCKNFSTEKLENPLIFVVGQTLCRALYFERTTKSLFAMCQKNAWQAREFGERLFLCARQSIFPLSTLQINKISLFQKLCHAPFLKRVTKYFSHDPFPPPKHNC
jgi:hypothetical protein